MSVDLKGNTNYTTLKDLEKNILVPRTNLSAIDLNVGLGIDVSGDTIAVKAATTDEITSGTSNRVVTADALKPVIDTIPEALTEGTGIDITSGTVSVALTAGDLMSINGATVSRLREMNIVNEADMATRTITAEGASKTALVLTPGDAYKISAVNADKYLATSADWKTSTSKWGLEGHIELFVAGTGRVHTDTNVHLTNALEPDAVNNCTVRFHDGMALISVEDHIAGELVTVQGGTTEGSLYYAIQTSDQEYVAFDAALNGLVIDIGGSTANGEKHVVGNSYSDTILAGGVSCTSKTTFANLAMSAVSILGGTMTLGDVFIPAGGTVSAAGGSLSIEKVTGDGGTIDLGQTRLPVDVGATVSVSGCTFTNGSGAFMGAVAGFGTSRKGVFVDCTFSGNSAGRGGALGCTGSGILELSNCTISGNISSESDIICSGGTTTLVNCTFGSSADGTNCAAALTYSSIVSCTNVDFGPCKIKFASGNGSGSVFMGGSQTLNTGTIQGTYGHVFISSGATLDLTGNAHSPAINPGAGVTFAPGGATIVPGGTASLAYTLGGMTVPRLGNTNEVNLSGTTVTASGGTIANATFTSGTLDMADVYIPQNATVSVGAGGVLSVEKVVGNSGTVDLGKTNVIVSSGVTATGSGVVFSNGSKSFGGFVSAHDGGSVSLSSCSVTGCSANYGGALYGVTGDARFRLVSCIISGNAAVNNGGAAALSTSNTLDVMDSVISGNTANEGKDVLVGPSATMRVSGGCTIGAVALAGGTVEIAGSNAIDRISLRNVSQFGSVVISSGAVIELTSRINPGGDIEVVGGTCTVNGHPIVASTYTSISSDGTTVPPQPA